MTTERATRRCASIPKPPAPTGKAGESDLDRLLFHCSEVVVCYDRELRYTFINDAGAAFLGSKVEDVIGRTNREIIGRGADAIEPHLRCVLEERDKLFVVHEIQLPGETRLFDTVYSPVLNTAGEVECVAGICRDVTDKRTRIRHPKEPAGEQVEPLEPADEKRRLEKEAHRKTAEALRRSEGRYRELADSITDLFFAMDQHLDVTYWNRASEEMTGTWGDRAVGRPVFEVLPGTGGTPLEEMFRRVQETRRPETLVQAGAFDGKMRSFEFHAYPSSSGGVSVFGRDISARIREEEEREQIQAELQASSRIQAVATLAGGMAHRFNNALSAVMGNLDLLGMDLIDLDAGVRESFGRYIDGMKESIEHMGDLTRQLLAYAQGGRYSPTVIPMDTFVRYTLPLLAHHIDPSISLEADLPGDLWSVEADTAQIQMLLSAVVQNAAEAIEAEGTIQISARNVPVADHDTERPARLEPGSYVRLTVKDDGAGMDEETLERIFDPFFTTKLQGRGLGMAAVFGIVRNHGGEITAWSVPGEGTRISIWLPAREIVGQEATPRREPVRAEGGTVLVVEDEEAVLEVFRIVLERMGYQVLIAPTGRQAVETVETSAERIDLVILDILLPDMDGRSVYPELIRARPDLKVIVTSGYSVEGPAREILDAGAQAFLPKPFSIQELRETITRVLGDAPSLARPP
ncbi:MAG: PAS domain-containing protein [Deltaproteobacteria bacterium]|nr:PAS domain-containing protein [Deltaproteobacteria bacterium]